jgi:hypothetical protein
MWLKLSTAVFSCMLVTESARADLPAVRFDRLTPLGGAAGSTVGAEKRTGLVSGWRENSRNMP